jgi:tRNA A-37 threonylcarbamoyl transferase component Bud32
MPQTFVDNRYTRGDLLGSGGMAEVYLAHDEVLDRDVALKVLKEQYAENEEFVKRFRHEARSAASLNHPNIVSIYDRGLSEDGADYIAMEYVPGGTLKDRISRDGVLDPGAAVGIAQQIVNGLSVAHENGVIHRDIKPQNILLTEAGYPKVNDFGIARAATATTTTSHPNFVLGTVGYISPEQAMGKPVDPRSDLYSLGVVLYEMLTGTLPYRGEDPASIAFKHVHEPPRSPQETNPNVPEPLDALTLKLLAKEPENRYANAAELADDLEQVRSGLSPLAMVTERMTIGEDTASLFSNGEKRMLVQPSATAPIMQVFQSGKRRRGWLFRALAMLLFSVILLGGLAWAVMQDYSAPAMPSSEDASTGDEAAPSTVQVPELYYASEAESTLTEAGLKLGNRSEASDDTVPVGVVVEQDPTAETTVEEDTAVDIVVSTGPKQVPTPVQPALTSVGAGSQQASATQASSTAAGPKQTPATVRAVPTGVNSSSQKAPTAQTSSNTSQITSTSSVHNNKVQKGQEKKKKKK